jgi:hypothetical protein
MPRRTIGDWYGRWADSLEYSWRSGDRSGYSDCHRIFINEQEMMLGERIQTGFIGKELLLADHGFRILAITA